MNVAFEFFNDFALRFQRELNQIELKLNWNELTTRTALPKHTHTLKYNCVYLCLFHSLSDFKCCSLLHTHTNTLTRETAAKRRKIKENKRQQRRTDCKWLATRRRLPRNLFSILFRFQYYIFFKVHLLLFFHFVSCTFVLCTPTTTNILHSALELRFFCLSLFSSFYFLPRGPRSMLSLAVLLREWT